MIVISDASPLHYLALINRIDLLGDLFGRVVVPLAVARELSHPAASEIVRALMSKPPGWLEIRFPAKLDPSLPRLGAGETQALSLALELHADLLLADDKDARRAAARRGIRVTGTV